MVRFTRLFLAICFCSIAITSNGYIHSDEELAKLNKESDEIQRTLNNFSENLIGESASKYKILINALNTYATAHANNENRVQGTGWADAKLYEEKVILEQFIDLFKKLDSQQRYTQSESNFKQKDGELNRLYQLLQKNENFDTEEAGAINWQGIKKTQRTWIKYRDSWLEFAALKFPTVTPHSLSTILTADRISVLEKIKTD